MIEKKISIQKSVIFFSILIFCFMAVYSQNTREARILFYKGRQLEEVKGELREAIQVYEQVLDQFPEERLFAARALLQIGVCHIKMGNQEGQQAFQRIIEDFAEQIEIVAEAQTRLQVLKKPTRLIAGEGMITRQVWADPQTDPSGSISPSGRYLSFIDWGKGDLLVRDITTGINRYLIENPSGCLDFAHYARWSPDGREIAYLWFSGVICDLRTIEVGGSAPRIIFSDEEVNWIMPGGWSPDGRFISASLSYRNKPDRHIALISVENGDKFILKSVDLKGEGLGPFSPDGRFIVYDCPQEGGAKERDIFLIATDGSGETRVVEHPADDRYLGLSPDGDWLFFLSDRSGSIDAWMIELNDGRTEGDPRLIRQGMGNVVSLGVTKDGVFYYSTGTRNRDPHVVDFDPQTLELISEVRRVNQRFVGFSRSLDWSPDGKYLAYLSTRRSMSIDSISKVLVIRSLETSDERELNLDESLDIPLAYLRWFPGNRFLLVIGSDWEGNSGFFRIDSQTAGVMPLILLKPGERFLFPSISPDGKAVYYKSITREDNFTRIVRKELETGEEQVLFEALRPERISAPALSPDGQTIVFQFREGTASPPLDILKIVPAEGGEPVELMREQVPRGRNINTGAGFIWTPDGSHIVFSRGSGVDLKTDLWIIPATGGSPKKLGLDLIGIQELRIHPDGRQIGFNAGLFNDEIWMLENLFPKK